MCGIAGVVDFESPVDPGLVDSMLGRLAHRGPDDRGGYAGDGVALGHLRLSIIDLSEAGRQPFADETGRFQLLHNGEIYNYRELRAELEQRGRRFRTATDTEVLLAAYETWGERCVERFAGMWAFVLWDAGRRTLFASRDRFGIKPLYYRHSGSRLELASEPRALLAAARTLPRPNPRAVRDFLEQGYADHLGETFFEGISPLPAAHSLCFDRDGLRLSRYWRLEPRAVPAGSETEAFRAALVDSVRLHLRSDVTVGTALSGGLDSSAIACTIGRLRESEPDAATPVGAHQQTFTAYFDDRGFDERPYAEAVVAATGAQPHWITFDERELVSVLPQIVAAQGEPFGSTSVVAQWCVMRAARAAGVKVMLDGQGGDEILAGYPAVHGYRIADLLAGGQVRAGLAELGAYPGSRIAAAAAAVTPFLPERLRWRLRGRRGDARSLVHPALRRLEPTPVEADVDVLPDRLRRRFATIMLERGLPELLRYEDRNSMAHSIEARVPFLDHRLVELAYGLPAERLIERGRTKVILREALADVLPPVVAARQDKLGFVTPEGRFLRGALGAYAERVLSEPKTAERGLVDAAAARKRLEDHRAGRASAGFELWRALSVELWARAYLDGEAAA